MKSQSSEEILKQLQQLLRDKDPAVKLLLSNAVVYVKRAIKQEQEQEKKLKRKALKAEKDESAAKAEALREIERRRRKTAKN